MDDWLIQRYNIRPRTRQLYKSLINRHLKPTFQRVPLTDITTASVRRWHASIATAVAARYRALVYTAASPGSFPGSSVVMST